MTRNKWGEWVLTDEEEAMGITAPTESYLITCYADYERLVAARNARLEEEQRQRLEAARIASYSATMNGFKFGKAFDRREVMKKAHAIQKTIAGSDWGLCLKEAWRLAKIALLEDEKFLILMADLPHPWEQRRLDEISSMLNILRNYQ